MNIKKLLFLLLLSTQICRAQQKISDGQYTLKNEIRNYISLQIKKDTFLFSEIGDKGRYYSEYKLVVFKRDHNKIMLQLFDKSNTPPILKDIKIFATIFNEKNKLFIESEYLKKKYLLNGRKELIKIK